MVAKGYVVERGLLLFAFSVIIFYCFLQWLNFLRHPSLRSQYKRIHRVIFFGSQPLGGAIGLAAAVDIKGVFAIYSPAARLAFLTMIVGTLVIGRTEWTGNVLKSSLAMASLSCSKNLEFSTKLLTIGMYYILASVSVILIWRSDAIQWLCLLLGYLFLISAIAAFFQWVTVRALYLYTDEFYRSGSRLMLDSDAYFEKHFVIPVMKMVSNAIGATVVMLGMLILFVLALLELRKMPSASALLHYDPNNFTLSIGGALGIIALLLLNYLTLTTLWIPIRWKAPTPPSNDTAQPAALAASGEGRARKPRPRDAEHRHSSSENADRSTDEDSSFSTRMLRCTWHLIGQKIFKFTEPSASLGMLQDPEPQTLPPQR
eukprot:TRINITY_DN17077_c1_g1_i1.p1 TRINITY_DN17077_c1_g1~~TRINITY_DN17077_c1_g1_i1.p1  ORF type:complete len:373 (+),score=51.46 TRINITY_DN17077_c1_g1_i1:27-1145(+)